MQAKVQRMSLDGADLERQSQAPLWGTVALSPAQPRHEGALAKFNVPSILVGVCLQTWRSPRWTVKSTGRRCRSRRARQAQKARGGAREPRLLRPHLAAGLWSALVSTTHLLGKLQIKNRNCPALGGGKVRMERESAQYSEPRSSGLQFHLLG